MESRLPFKGNGGSHKPLPKPNAKMKMSGSGDAFTEAELRGLFSNPIYAGIGPYPALASDEEWVAGAVTFIKEEGAEQFLVNMLHLLRQSFKDASL